MSPIPYHHNAGLPSFCLNSELLWSQHMSACVFIVGLEEVGQHLAQWARSRCSDVSLIGIWSLLDHVCNTQCPLKSDGRLWPFISSVGISCCCLPFSWLACPFWAAITFPRNWSHHPLEYIFMWITYRTRLQVPWSQGIDLHVSTWLHGAYHSVFYVETRCLLNALFMDSSLRKHLLNTYYMPGIQRSPIAYLKDLAVVGQNRCEGNACKTMKLIIEGLPQLRVG